MLKYIKTLEENKEVDLSTQMILDNYLKEQDKEEELKQVKKQLDQALNDLNESQKSNENLNNLVSELRNRNNQTNELKSKLDKAIDELKEKCHKLERSSSHDLVNQLQDELNKKSSKLLDLELLNQSLNEILKENRIIIDELKRKLIEKDDLLYELKGNLISNNERLSNQNNLIYQKENELKGLKKQFESVLINLKALEDYKNMLENKLEETKNLFQSNEKLLNEFNELKDINKKNQEIIHQQQEELLKYRSTRSLEAVINFFNRKFNKF